MSGKDLRFGDEARALMLKGVDQLANAVQVRARRCQRTRWWFLVAVEGSGRVTAEPGCGSCLCA
jgi:hypothetical protein